MRPFTWLVIVLIFLLGLPPFGLLLKGYPLPSHLTLFPISLEPGESSISWPIMCLLAFCILATLIPVFFQFFTFNKRTTRESCPSIDFPWWGWLAILWITGSWLLAWTRFSWFWLWQPHTFPLLWFGYITLLNALTYQRSGQCMITHQPQVLCHLLLLSAGFWWAFEYLNQYVNNWHYLNVPATSHFAYILYTSISFSTVLPAVLSTYEWLNTFPRLTKPFGNWHPLPWINTQNTSWILLGLGTSGPCIPWSLANHSFPITLDLPVVSSSRNPIYSKEKDLLTCLSAG